MDSEHIAKQVYMSDTGGESSHEQLVQSVVDFTGTSVENAKSLLEESGWNVPEAVSRFFLQVDAVSAQSSRQPSRGRPNEQIARAPRQQQPIPTGAAGPGWNIGELLKGLLNALRSCMGWSWYQCWSACKMFLVGTGISSANVDRISDPNGSLSVYFESLPEGVVRPVSFRGSFQEAATASRRRDERKVLIIFLHDSLNSEFESSIQSVICNDAFTAVINNQFMFWAGDAGRPNPMQLARALRVRTLPAFIAVISVNATEIKVVAGCMGPQFTVEAVLGVLQKAQEEQDRLMAEDEQFKINRTLREDQDIEYQEGLERDRLAQEARDKVEEARRVKEEREAKRVREAEDERMRLYSKFHGLPTPTTPTTIVVRLPGGVRIERIFDHSDTVETLYEWVLCSGLMYPHVVESVKGIEKGRFTLSTSFPSKRLDVMRDTLSDSGLVPNAVLVISILDDSSDSE